MNEIIPPERPTVPPHSYPKKIAFFAILIVLATVYSLTRVPKYLVAARHLHAAEIAFDHKQYDQSIELYKSVLRDVPTSKTGRIEAAIVLFSRNAKGDDDSALNLLSEVTLEKKDWAKVSAVMPTEYQKYFTQEPR